VLGSVSPGDLALVSFAASWSLYHALLGVVADRGPGHQLVCE
jgi:hypothetical protein